MKAVGWPPGTGGESDGLEFSKFGLKLSINTTSTVTLFVVDRSRSFSTLPKSGSSRCFQNSSCRMRQSDLKHYSRHTVDRCAIRFGAVYSRPICRAVREDSTRLRSTGSGRFPLNSIFGLSCRRIVVGLKKSSSSSITSPSITKLYTTILERP